MQSVQEIRQLKEELEKLTGFIADNGKSDRVITKDVEFACNISDALYWVLGEISTEHFRGDCYIKLERVKRIAKSLERATGKKLADYR